MTRRARIWQKRSTATMIDYPFQHSEVANQVGGIRLHLQVKWGGGHDSHRASLVIEAYDLPDDLTRQVYHKVKHLLALFRHCAQRFAGDFGYLC